jgi:hypothetical protein
MVNFQKSSMIALNVSDSKMADLASVFGCQIASMPFTYLPWVTTKPHMVDLMP